ncbi:MAG: glycoside hydrolase family 2 protein [Halobacteriaceae archaeon]
MTASDPPRPEHPRPQRRREPWRCLNGTWGFERDPGKSGRARGLPTADALAEAITVPFPPESDLSGVGDRDFHNQVWYRREVDVPADWLDGGLLLHFGAVDYEAEVWIDGESVGTHRGGYAPFAVDVADVATPGRTVVTVCARDEVRTGRQPAGKQSQRYASSGAEYTRVTGIWQPVWLEPVPATRVAEFDLRPDLANGVVRGRVEVAGDARDLDATVAARLDGTLVGETTVAVAGGRAQFAVPLDEVRAWRPADPALYDLTIRLTRDGEPVDAVESYCGLRSVAVEDGAVLLNGEARFQRLVLDQGYYPDGLYTAPADDALAGDVERGLAMGFDGARLHEKVFEPRFLYHADRLGYLVWGEFGDWQLDRTDPATLGPVLQEWLEVVARDRNHPALVGWTPFNETPRDRDADLQRTVYRATKRVDPTRPVVDASGYRHVETDLLDVHDYTQDVETFRDRYAVLAEGRGLDDLPHDRGDDAYGPALSYVSEFGGIWWNPDDEGGWGYGDRPESEAAFLDRYRGLTEALLENPAVALSCYTQLYDIQQEQNGLYTDDREPKFDPETIREITAQDATVDR